MTLERQGEAQLGRQLAQAVEQGRGHGDAVGLPVLHPLELGLARQVDPVDALLARPLKPYTEQTICDPAQLRAQLQEVRRLGYSSDDEEHEAGVRAVSAPIRDRQGKVAAAIAMPGPISRIQVERFPEFAEALVAAANAIATHMGWRV